MKLAEALMRRSEMEQRRQSLVERALANLKVQEGETPQEDAEALLKEASALLEEQAALIKRINARNMQTQLPDGQPLSEALVDRECLVKERMSLQRVADQASQQNFRVTRTELRMVTTVPIGNLQRRIDRLSKEIRELDIRIQETNWQTVL